MLYRFSQERGCQEWPVTIAICGSNFRYAVTTKSQGVSFTIGRFCKRSVASGAGHSSRSEYSIIPWNDGAWMGKQPGVGNFHHHAPRSWPKLPDASELEKASAMFRALGDPARLRLLARLAWQRSLRNGVGGLGGRIFDFGSWSSLS